MWMPCSSPCPPSPYGRSRELVGRLWPPAGTGTRRPSLSSTYLRCQKSSSACTTGISAKLYSGGGEGIVHSSVRPSHGSAPAVSPRFRVLIDVVEEDQQRQRDQERADRRDQVPEVEAVVLRVLVGAARHPLQAEDVHRRERQVEADHHQPEVQLADALVEQLPEDLRPPVVDAGEQPEDRAAEQHVVEVRHDVVRVGLLVVVRHDRVRDAGEAADR